MLGSNPSAVSGAKTSGGGRDVEKRVLRLVASRWDWRASGKSQGSGDSVPSSMTARAACVRLWLKRAGFAGTMDPPSNGA